MDDFPFGLFVVCLLWIGVCGGAGYAIGNSKGIAGMGAFLGAVFGPIGLIITAILPSEEGVREPDVYVPRATAYPSMSDNRVPEPVARVARMVSQPRAIAGPSPCAPPPPRFYICAVGGEPEGPFDGTEIARLRVMGHVTDSTLFCREGEQEWKSAPPRSN